MMPRRDGSGPMGTGAMTGKNLGLCGGANVSRFGYCQGDVAGLGLGCRHGHGFSGRSIRRVTIDQSIERTDKELLEEQKKLLQSRLDTIDKQLEEL